MKIKQEERKKKTPKRKKKQQQQKRPSRSGQRKSNQKQSYKVHMLDGQAKDIRIKDLEAELAAMKTKLLEDPKDIRIKDLEAELRALKKDDKTKDIRILYLEAELREFEVDLEEGFKIKDMCIKNLEEDLRIGRQWLMMEQDAKQEAMSRLASYKNERDKSDAMAMQKDPVELHRSMMGLTIPVRSK